jgi:hypothetical protein
MQSRLIGSGRAGSRVPLLVGGVAAGLATLGLLVTAVTSASVAGIASRVQDGDVVPPIIFAVQSTVSVVAFLIGLALLRGGRDAGRSATLWIAVATVPWLATMAFYFAGGTSSGLVSLYGERYEVAADVGLAAVSLVAVAALVAMIALAAAGGRRWRADPAPEEVDALPAPLLATKARFGLSAVLGVSAGVALIVVFPEAAIGEGPDPVSAAYALALGLAVAVVVPEIIVWVGGSLARRGRRDGVLLARVGGGLAVCGFAIVMALAAVALSTAVEGPGPGVDLVAAPICLLAIVGLLVSLGLLVAGLAGLADPRTGSYLLRR